MIGVKNQYIKLIETTLSQCLVKLCRDTILLLKVNQNPYSAALPHLPFLSSVFQLFAVFSILLLRSGAHSNDWALKEESRKRRTRL